MSNRARKIKTLIDDAIINFINHSVNIDCDCFEIDYGEIKWKFYWQEN